MEIIEQLGAAALAALVSAGICLGVVKGGWALAVPDERSSHSVPTPRLGGVGILVGAGVGLAALAALAPAQFADLTEALGGLWGGMGIVVLTVAALGDDFLAFGFHTKLLAQTAAALLVMFSGCVIAGFPLPLGGTLTSFGMVYGLTLLWLVGLTNAFNFMDGLDGLSGGQAVIAAIFLGLTALSTGNGWLLSLSIIVGAAVLGFLVFNFPPARLFMGDTGSQVLGFVFAFLAVAASLDADAPVPLFVVPMLFFGFIWDTVFTFFRRLTRGERVSEAHKSHLYQLLNQSGYSHRAVTLISYGMMSVQGLCALMLARLGDTHAYGLLVPLMVIQGVYTVWVWRQARRRGLV